MNTSSHTPVFSHGNRDQTVIAEISSCGWLNPHALSDEKGVIDKTITHLSENLLPNLSSSRPTILLLSSRTLLNLQTTRRCRILTQISTLSSNQTKFHLFEAFDIHWHGQPTTILLGHALAAKLDLRPRDMVPDLKEMAVLFHDPSSGTSRQATQYVPLSASLQPFTGRSIHFW
jgi:hypothetical protein